MQLFCDADVPRGPVHDARSLVEDPQFLTRTALVEHEHPEAGAIRMVGTPIHTGEPPVVPPPAPGHGQDTDDVLGGLLGYEAAEIAGLRDRGVIV